MSDEQTERKAHHPVPVHFISTDSLAQRMQCPSDSPLFDTMLDEMIDLAEKATPDGAGVRHIHYRGQDVALGEFTQRKEWYFAASAAKVLGPIYRELFQEQKRQGTRPAGKEAQTEASPVISLPDRSEQADSPAAIADAAPEAEHEAPEETKPRFTSTAQRREGHIDARHLRHKSLVLHDAIAAAFEEQHIPLPSARTFANMDMDQFRTALTSYMAMAERFPNANEVRAQLGDYLANYLALKAQSAERNGPV